MGLPIVTVNVVLRTATVSRAGFGTPIFIAPHNNFLERVRTYQSLNGVGDDFNSTDAVYIAAQAVFSHTPSVGVFKVGRVDTDSSVYTPKNVTTGAVYTIKVTLENGDTATLSYTAQAMDDATDVSTQLVSDINGNATLTGSITASLINDTVSVSGSVGYVVEASSNLLSTFTTSEGVADSLDAIDSEDDDFYFVTAQSHDQSYVIDLAAVVETKNRLYFTSSADFSALGVYNDASTDTPAKLAQLGYKRTAVLFSQEADTKFPELSYVGTNAPYSPDETSVVWDGREMSGFDIARGSNGIRLTATQMLNLDKRNTSYIARTAVGNRVLGGKTSSGEWIDNIRTADCVEARVSEGLNTLILNQAGGKLVGGIEGVSLCAAQVLKDLTPFVASKAFSGTPRVFTDNATIDQDTRTLRNLEFEAVLAGAIIRAVVNGTLTNDDEV